MAPTTPAVRPNVDWQREIALEETLDFDAALATTGEPRHVFLTGATGLLGAFVLDELLRSTSARVSCLVRAATPAAARVRLVTHFEQLGLPSAALADRVLVLAGELEDPHLGVGRAGFDRLAEQTDTIVHAAARIHFLQSYAGLRATNVGGTKTVLRLATTRSRKPLHLVSSLAVFFGSGSGAGPTHERISELDEPDIASLRTGYAQSKWVAEQLALSAGRRGLPVVIHRAGRISGHSQTGSTCAWDDLASRLLKACVVLGAYPAWDTELSLAPVDFVSGALVHLVRQPRAWGRCFHLFDRRPLRWRELMSIFGELGYAMVETEHQAWLALLKRVATQDHPERETLARLWMALASGRAMLSPGPSYETPNSDVELAGVECPRINAEVVTRYVEFFVAAGYLPAPGVR